MYAGTFPRSTPLRNVSGATLSSAAIWCLRCSPESNVFVGSMRAFWQSSVFRMRRVNGSTRCFQEFGEIVSVVAEWVGCLQASQNARSISTRLTFGLVFSTQKSGDQATWRSSRSAASRTASSWTVVASVRKMYLVLISTVMASAQFRQCSTPDEPRYGWDPRQNRLLREPGHGTTATVALVRSPSRETFSAAWRRGKTFIAGGQSAATSWAECPANVEQVVSARP